MSSPTETELTFKEKVKADKKLILERAFSADLLKHSSNIVISDPINNLTNKKRNNSEKENTASQTSNILTNDEFAEIFGDDDVDDSEEIFQKALKKAEELFEREMKIKETNPFYRSSREILDSRSKRASNRKSKVIRDSENIMNTFKKALMERKEPQKFSSTTGTTFSTQKSCRKNSKSLASRVSVVNLPSTITIPPIWKTPKFLAPTNPRWHKDRLNTPTLTNKSKMYTPGHINDWIGNNSSANCIGSPPRKKRRSDIDTHNSTSDEDNFLSCTKKPMVSSTPMHNLDLKQLPPTPIESPVCSSSPKHSATVQHKPTLQKQIGSPDCSSIPIHKTAVQHKSPQKQIDSPVYSNTPMRSTTVRFRPSPPEHFIYSDGNSTVSSNSFVLEEDDLNQYKNNNLYSPAFYSSEDENEGNIQISPANIMKLNHQATFYNQDFGNSKNYEVFEKYTRGNFSNNNAYKYKENNFNSPAFYLSDDENKDNIQTSPANIEKLNNRTSFFNQDFKNSKKYEVFEKYERGQFINNIPKHNPNISQNSTNPKIFVENFVQNLKYNISNNYQMEVEYSMKLKYSK